MEFFCNNSDAIISLLISGILGALGQALRIGIGLYKLNLEKNPLVQSADLSNPSNKLGGIFIGLLVGITITLVTNSIFKAFTPDRAIALIASGYAVTHLLENVTAIIAQKQKSLFNSSENNTDSKKLSVSPLKREEIDS